MKKSNKIIEVEEIVEIVNTSSRPALARTDCGLVYVKAINERDTPHILVCELVGTRIAQWLGLQTLCYGVVEMLEDVPIEYNDGTCSVAGPAFATIKVNGRPWSGDISDIRSNVENLDDIAKLVVLDTWTRNIDRFSSTIPGFGNFPIRRREVRNVRNVFFCEDGATKGKWRLVAMDQGHCFTGGQEISKILTHIDRIKDNQVFGLFEEFKPFIQPIAIYDICKELAAITTAECENFVADIPPEWLGHNPTVILESLVDFIYNRAIYLSQNLEASIEGQTRWQSFLPGVH